MLQWLCPYWARAPPDFTGGENVITTAGWVIGCINNNDAEKR